MTLQLKDMALLRNQGFIDGQWAAADSGLMFPVTNPATGATLVQIADMGVAETRRAIDAAGRALPGWRAKTAKERAAVLRKWYDLILAHADDLALLMTSERASRWPRHVAKWCTALRSSNGSPRRASARTATSSRAGCRTGV
jgi:acyl-CoA reductase-like NAD-dependent aldehyde dehydrogenase